MALNPLAVSDVDNEVLRESDDYLRKHKILELFEVSKIKTLFFTHIFNFRILQPFWHISSQTTWKASSLMF